MSVLLAAITPNASFPKKNRDRGSQDRVAQP